MVLSNELVHPTTNLGVCCRGIVLIADSKIRVFDFHIEHVSSELVVTGCYDVLRIERGELSIEQIGATDGVRSLDQVMERYRTILV